jgi:hypothetical protein
MKPATVTPAFVTIYPVMCEAARECGYALAIHGTLARDLDVVAVPWTDGATDCDTVVRTILESVNAYFQDGACFVGGEWVVRHAGWAKVNPHGRLSYSMHLGGGPFVDLSVMPRILSGHEPGEGDK